ncbi:MAG: serine hydrolase [Muricauda sp.]|nr:MULTISPECIES: serine hydrolase domain-containing protein [unclassified Allomuricauda]MAU16379.1 serine hydrolase [Allomuricauda sp.]|tara:strand:+ start:3563 stop:5155 length:1593 start_codon:yes stop_codon:yes gene_type:complete
MKHLLYQLTAICLVTSLLSCSTKQTPETIAETPARSYSESYKAPIFDPDDRIEKIKQIAPELQRSIEEHAKANHLPGVAFGIVVDNELVFTTATGYLNLEKKIPASPSAAFRIASMTKSFTAMAIIKLRDEGKLSLNDPVSKYIPEMSKLTYLTKDAPTIDIENLLTMTAGFPEDNPWGDRQLDEPDQMLIDLVDDGISFSNVPSYGYEYSNTGYALLGHIVSQVSGMPYQDYITQNIFKPLGMDHTYWEYEDIPEEQLAIGYRWEDEQWKLEPMLHDGAFGAMGGLITSIEDFSKYVSFHLSAWPPRNDDDNGPIKRSSLREMQTPQFPRLYANAKDHNGDDCAILSGYGFGLGITEYCNGLKRVSHGGALPGFGSNYTFYPEYGVGIMAFCNLTYTSPWSLNELSKLLFETADLQPRKLPASDVLLERQEQLTQLIQNWEPTLEEQILAENFYLDRSREKRRAAIQEVLEKAGAIEAVGDLHPINQLRGRYTLQAENGKVNIFFTLTPEKYPKVQRLDVAFEPNEPDA